MLVPAALLTAPGVVDVQVVNPGGTVSNLAAFQVLLGPSLNTLVPAAIPAGSPDFTLGVTGANFVPGSQIVFNGNAAGHYLH